MDLVFVFTTTDFASRCWQLDNIKKKKKETNTIDIMSTKSGLKKTFSWRFGPSKFSRKSKPHSEVWIVLTFYITIVYLWATWWSLASNVLILKGLMLHRSLKFGFLNLWEPVFPTAPTLYSIFNGVLPIFFFLSPRNVGILLRRTGEKLNYLFFSVALKGKPRQ